MGTWHQVASATATIAFLLSLLLASQVYVTSRLSAAELATTHVLKLRSAGRAQHGH